MTAATLPKVNTKKLIALGEWVGAQQARKEMGLLSEWVQTSWLMKVDELTTVKVSSCGTACCVAGKAALDAGWVPSQSVVPLDLGPFEKPEDYLWDDLDTDDFVVQVDKQGRQVGELREVEEVARQLLGLTDREAEALFNGDNEFDDIMRAIREILAGEHR